MGRQIIKQPNGLYAQWSSIVDDFVMIDATPQDIIDDWVNHEKEQIEKHVYETIEKLEKGDKPYYQFTKTFEQAIEEIRERHGNDSESLRMLEIDG